MNSLKNIGRLATVAVRQAQTSNVHTTARALNNSENIYLKRVKGKQEKFQVEDGKPVFLKGGAMDKTLYYITMGLSVGGLVAGLKYIVESFYPDKE